MCNSYAMRHAREEARALAKALRDLNNNQPPMPGIFPDYSAPVIRNSAEGRVMANARWSLPSPAFALEGKKADSGVTNGRQIFAYEAPALPLEAEEVAARAKGNPAFCQRSAPRIGQKSRRSGRASTGGQSETPCRDGAVRS